MFDIRNSRDFYAKLLADFDDFMENQESARHAMNCAITAHHMHDWVWSDYLKSDEGIRNNMGIPKDKGDFSRWIDAHSVWFAIVQEISNGSKHFGRRSPVETRRVTGYGMGAYGVGPYGRSYLEVDLGEDAGEHRFMTVIDLLEVVVRFWRDFMRHYSPYRNELPRGQTRLMDE
ncbi:MAG TPA: hypothetical protein VIJ04_02645 [Xanthobacteraceae bacterium]